MHAPSKTSLLSTSQKRSILKEKHLDSRSLEWQRIFDPIILDLNGFPRRQLMIVVTRTRVVDLGCALARLLAPESSTFLPRCQTPWMLSYPKTNNTNFRSCYNSENHNSANTQVLAVQIDELSSWSQGSLEEFAPMPTTLCFTYIHTAHSILKERPDIQFHELLIISSHQASNTDRLIMSMSRDQARLAWPAESRLESWGWVKLIVRSNLLY